MPLPVLVVGGGPAGVVAALELARRSVGVRVVDRAAGPLTGSRAKGLQPRTLELLEALGVVEEILAAGGRFPRWRSYRGAQPAREKSIYELLGMAEPAPDPAVPYPETWMIPQWRTEEILRRALSRCGVEVEYGSSLTGLEPDGGGVTATIARAAGSERVRASYLVGADGAASAVRRAIGVSFDGVTRDHERFVIADVRTADLDRVYWHNWSDPRDPTARVSICPLPGTDKLNTAVQDSFNLGWKLASVLAGAPEHLLDSYEEERRPIAARLMAGPGIPDEQGERPDVFQLRNTYRGRSLSAETRPTPGPVRAGDRAPDAPLRLPGAAPSRLFELMRGTELTCVAFGAGAAEAGTGVARRWRGRAADDHFARRLDDHLRRLYAG